MSVEQDFQHAEIPHPNQKHLTDTAKFLTALSRKERQCQTAVIQNCPGQMRKMMNEHFPWQKKMPRAPNDVKHVERCGVPQGDVLLPANSKKIPQRELCYFSYLSEKFCR